ncbi:MAG: folate family ECF transporter S component [Oscillospiraceae bacterium]|nr:folate family ECF transporter S component [Oscillospiraceae bacterium]
MRTMKNLFRQSLNHCKSTRALALSALFVGIIITMDMLNIRLQFTPQLRITFDYLFSASIGMLFGPVLGLMSGFCADLLGYLMNSGGGAYFPGFTITAMVAGLIYGLLLYYPPKESKRFFLRCLITKGMINLICNVILNTYWFSLTGGEAMSALLPLRLAKNLVLWVPEALLMFLVLNLVRRISHQFPALRREDL